MGSSNTLLSDYNILIAPSGRKYLDKNIGTNSSFPMGKHYTFDEAQRLCPPGTRLPNWDEVEEDIKWLSKTLPLAASGNGGQVGYIGYYWTSEDNNIEPGSAIFFLFKNENDTLIQVSKKTSLFSARCIVNF